MSHTRARLRRAFAALGLMAMCAGPLPAWAESESGAEPLPEPLPELPYFSGRGPALPFLVPDEDARVLWHPEWRRNEWIDYTMTVALSLSALLANLLIDSPKNWTGGILFDDQARELFRGKSRDTRINASMASDVLFFGLLLYPGVESFLIAGEGNGNFDLAWEMFWNDLQAHSVSGAMTLWSSRLTGRQRPGGEGCETDPNYVATCPLGNHSFFSGHTTQSFTTAGLICRNASATGIYGSGLAGGFACGTGLAVASTVAYLRLVAEQHWASDVMVGALVGFTAGFFLPQWLHYGWGSDEDSTTMMLMPTANTQGMGLTLSGQF